MTAIGNDTVEQVLARALRSEEIPGFWDSPERKKIYFQQRPEDARREAFVFQKEKRTEKNKGRRESAFPVVSPARKKRLTSPERSLRPPRRAERRRWPGETRRHNLRSDCRIDWANGG